MFGDCKILYRVPFYPRYPDLQDVVTKVTKLKTEIFLCYTTDRSKRGRKVVSRETRSRVFILRDPIL